MKKILYKGYLTWLFIKIDFNFHTKINFSNLEHNKSFEAKYIYILSKKYKIYIYILISIVSQPFIYM